MNGLMYALRFVRVVVLISLAACSANKPAAAVMRGAPAEVAAGSPAPVPDGIFQEMPICAPDNPFCHADPVITGSAGAAGEGGPLVATTRDCGSLPIDLTPAGVNIVLAVDGAASMREHWADVGTAIRSLRANNATAAFGMHLFWADAADPLDEADFSQAWNMSNNACSSQTFHTSLRRRVCSG